MIDLDKILKDGLKLELSTSQLDTLLAYENLLLEWNCKFNLTAIIDPDEIRIKHFYDSLTCLLFLPQHPFSLIDIGCGAGFPGIPIKIVRPDVRLVLVESVRKKADFCQAVIESLQLHDVLVLPERAETIGQDPAHREKYDWAVARAVAPLPVLLEYLLPLVHPGGSILAQKGPDPHAEITQASKGIAVLGGETAEIQELDLPMLNEKRTLITIRKNKSTPSKYPRKPGTPAKKPLG